MSNPTLEAVKDLHPVEAVKNLDPVAAAKKAASSAGRFKKLVPGKVSRKFARQALVLQKNSPQLLFVGGLVLGGATIVTACRATLQVGEVLESMQADIEAVKEVHRIDSIEHDAPKTKKRLTYIYATGSVKLMKLYGPSFILGVTSVACLTGAHNIQNTRLAGMTAAYTALDKGVKQYRNRIAGEFGEDKERELWHDAKEVTVVTEEANGPKKRKATVHNPNGGASPYARVYDEVTARDWQPTPNYNRTFIQCQQNWANDLLQSRGHLFLNEVYDMLGLERSKAGQVVGWVLDNEGDNYVDFGLFHKNTQQVHDFMAGNEQSILLDFNVDGPVLDKI